MHRYVKAKQQQLVVELTERCNNACLHCYNFWRALPTSYHMRQGLSRNKIRDLVQRIRREAPLLTVALSGGEPAVRRDLEDVVCDLTDDGLNIVVITNSVLLNQSRLRRFPEGTLFETTLFSSDAELHDRMAGNQVFDRVVSNLLEIGRHRCNFVLACVITKLNAHDVERTIKLGLALGAGAVLLNRINLSHHVLPLASRLVPSESQLRLALEAAEKAAERYAVPVVVSVPIPACLANPRDYPHLHFCWCPRGGKDAYYTVSCSGQLRPCNHSSVVLGDLAKQNYGEIVAGEAAKQFWDGLPFQCRACENPLRNQCQGGCRAAADECHGTPLRIDPFVELVRQNEHSANRN